MSQLSLHKFFRYAIAGATTAGLELGVFVFLTSVGVWYIVSNAIAFAVAVCYGFLIQKYWTFRHREKDIHRQVISFLIVMCIAYALTNFYLYLFIDIFQWKPSAAKMVQLVLVFLSNYLLQSLYTFRKK